MVKANLKQLGIGIGALLTGYAEYLVYRPWGNGDGRLVHLPLELMDKNGGIEHYLHSIPNYFGNIHGWMPDYLGVLGQSLLCVSLSTTKSATKAEQYSMIGTITGVSILMELGQYVGILPGTYDPKDVLAYVGGAITAAIITRMTTPKEGLEDAINEMQPNQNPITN
jgi:hypothetical protein